MNLSDTDLIELVMFALESLLIFLGTFSVIAKITPWDDKALAEKLKNSPDSSKKWLSRLLWAIKILGLAKKRN